MPDDELLRKSRDDFLEIGLQLFLSGFKP